MLPLAGDRSFWNGFMSYFDRLHPWCIVRPLPNMQRRLVQRFRRRNDAEAYLRILRQQAPMLQYAIVFDPVGSSGSGG